MEVVAFPSTWQEMVQFLIEEGFAVIEKHRTHFEGERHRQ
jgi:hypothetical protein